MRRCVRCVKMPRIKSTGKRRPLKADRRKSCDSCHCCINGSEHRGLSRAGFSSCGLCAALRMWFLWAHMQGHLHHFCPVTRMTLFPYALRFGEPSDRAPLFFLPLSSARSYPCWSLLSALESTATIISSTIISLLLDHLTCNPRYSDS